MVARHAEGLGRRFSSYAAVTAFFDPRVFCFFCFFAFSLEFGANFGDFPSLNTPSLSLGTL
jgi:hypothetical protein